MHVIRSLIFSKCEVEIEMNMMNKQKLYSLKYFVVPVNVNRNQTTSSFDILNHNSENISRFLSTRNVETALSDKELCQKSQNADKKVSNQQNWLAR